jgi:hypothetical protein
MATNITEAHTAFELLFSKLIDKSFAKTLGFEEWGEKNLLPSVRTFLLGYFRHSVTPEVQSPLPGTVTGIGKIDFLIDDIAIEFAVRKPNDSKNKILNNVNETEVKKLLKYQGKSLLVLFDFSQDPLESSDLEAFRYLPSLGKGNHNKSPFQISYFFKNGNDVGHHKKQIRVH